MTNPFARCARPLSVLLALAALSSAARAQNCQAPFGAPQSCTTGITFQFTALRTVQVVVTPTTVNFGTPTSADFNQGFMQAPAAQAVAVNANTPWTITIRGTAATWTNVGAGSNAAKPLSDLRWATAPAGPYSATPGPGAGSAVQIASGNATDLATVNVYYRSVWSWASDTPGTYTIPITFLITAP
jgi:hypothetical protein